MRSSAALLAGVMALGAPALPAELPREDAVTVLRPPIPEEQQIRGVWAGAVEDAGGAMVPLEVTFGGDSLPPSEWFEGSGLRAGSRVVVDGMTVFFRLFEPLTARELAFTARLRGPMLSGTFVAGNEAERACFLLPSRAPESGEIARLEGPLYVREMQPGAFLPAEDSGEAWFYDGRRAVPVRPVHPDLWLTPEGTALEFRRDQRGVLDQAVLLDLPEDVRLRAMPRLDLYDHHGVSLPDGGEAVLSLPPGPDLVTPVVVVVPSGDQPDALRMRLLETWLLWRGLALAWMPEGGSPEQAGSLIDAVAEVPGVLADNVGVLAFGDDAAMALPDLAVREDVLAAVAVSPTRESVRTLAQWPEEGDPLVTLSPRDARPAFGGQEYAAAGELLKEAAKARANVEARQISGADFRMEEPRVYAPATGPQDTVTFPAEEVSWSLNLLGEVVFEEETRTVLAPVREIVVAREYQEALSTHFREYLVPPDEDGDEEE